MLREVKSGRRPQGESTFWFTGGIGSIKRIQNEDLVDMRVKRVTMPKFEYIESELLMRQSGTETTNG